MKRFYRYMKKNKFLAVVLTAVAVLAVLILWVYILEWADEHIIPVYQEYQNENMVVKL